MFKRTVSFLFVIALLAGLFAGGAGATMYYYNIPDVQKSAESRMRKGPEGQEVHHRDHLGRGRGSDVHADRKVPGNGTLRASHRAKPRNSRSR